MEIFQNGAFPNLEYNLYVLCVIYNLYVLCVIFYVFVLSCVCYVFVRVCLYVLCGHMLGKG